MCFFIIFLGKGGIDRERGREVGGRGVFFFLMLNNNILVCFVGFIIVKVGMVI